MPRSKYLLLSAGIVSFLVTWLSTADSTNHVYAFQQENVAPPPDSTRKDSLPDSNLLRRVRKPSFFSHDRYGDPFSNQIYHSPLNLGNPSGIKLDVQADSSGNVTIYEKLGDLDYRPANSMSYKQFSEYQDRRLSRDYWQTKGAEQDGKSEVTGRNLIPKIYISPVFDRIFGGNYIDFKTNGFLNLDFGGRAQRVENPNIPVRQQKNGFFDFDQQISMNVIGQVGEKMRMTANFDTKSSFQFEQNLKLEYTGFEEDIIQKIEAGNVSMPLNSTLISGAQNLFGLKTQLRFGRLSVTSIVANQRAQLDEVRVQGGVQTRKFEIRASDYEDNRHFFLSQFFRSRYEASLRTIPVISSGMIITRLEVYVTNRTNNTQTLRNIVGLMDLGEGNAYKPNLPVMGPVRTSSPASNDANGLYQNLYNSGVRQADNATSVLEGLSLVKGEDYELLRASRKLTDREYTFHPELGYISLTTPLRNDEVLAVSYEYTLNGRRYKVGELTEDYQDRREDEVILLKLLRPSTVRIDLPTWNLMMKNIYSLNANQINREGFQLRIIYKDDITGIDNPSLQEGQRTQNVPLLQLLNMDQLNPQGDPQIDGNFDFIEGITINTQYGRIIFPVLEPFGSHLATKFTAGEQDLRNKYVFTTLYNSTKQEAQQVADKNKFFIKGSLQSASSNEIMLPTIGADDNAVTVTAGGTPLVAGQDYIIENGQVRIINESITNSGREIRIQYEKPDLFQNQMRTLFGTRLEYELDKDLVIGSTFMRLRERPILTRIGMGNEPTNNGVFGADINLRRQSRFLTSLVDKLPLLETKEISGIAFSGEYARLFPGVSPLAQGNSFIDDFEGAETPFNLGARPNISWKLGATPRMFPYNPAEPLSAGYRRAKLAWYTVDNVFYRNSGANIPANITETDRQNHYVRPFLPQDIFQGMDEFPGQLFEPIFDLTYYPAERGMYNFNPRLQPNGTLENPRESWAAISRAMTYDIDFDNANIQYIEFWLMDPFIKGDNGRGAAFKDPSIDNMMNPGGDLFFNLGSVSEDVMKDGRHSFENGLPTSADPTQQADETAWGRVPRRQYLNDAFENQPGTREQQDVGLNGLSSTEEVNFYQNFINSLTGLNPEVRQQILRDPAGDDFQYFLGPELDQNDVKILERYKNFNGMEGNSPVASDAPYASAGTTLPDNEDLNKDNTISELEEYYQYRVSMRPEDFRVGRNYIVDSKQVDVPVPGGRESVTWYQFRIPIRENYERVGNINGFKSIRFMRMFVTGFANPVVLRFARYQLVSNTWRQYTDNLFDTGLQVPNEPYDAQFTIATVNIEENGNGGQDGYNYVLPPGFQRDRDITTLNNRQINEQSLKLSVENLNDRDARAAFKNVSLDLINYKRLRMFLHANSEENLQPGEVTAFIRLGTDFNENYYEVEVPLTMSPRGAIDPEVVWPAENEIDIALAELVNVKTNRNRNNASLIFSYSERVGKYNVTVKGNPDLSAILTIMIGMRNPDSPDRRPRSFTIWANELRASEFDEESGWAAAARASIKLADFGTINASARHTTYGFGGIQQRISERARANTTDFDVSSTFALEKFLPSNWGLRVPLFMSYEKQTITPRFNPLDPDVRLSQSLDALRENQNRSDYRKLVEENSVRRSINFSDVRKERTNPDAKVRLYDIENFSFTYAYSDITRTNITTEQYQQKNYRGGVGYSYSTTPRYIEPFKSFTFLGSPLLKWIQEFNFSLAPSNITVRGDLNRNFTRTQLRSGDLTTVGILPMFEKFFTFNRLYDVKWNLTRSLSLDYSATANAVIDEPFGDIDTREKRDTIINNLRNLGRMKNFSQRVSANYRVPLDKFPLTDWLNADVRYSAGFNWQAASLAAKDTLGVFFGNSIQNHRERNLVGKIDLLRLYNKVRFLKALNEPAPQNRPPAQAKADTVAKKPEFRAFKAFARALMSARAITVNYSVDERTAIAGFLPTPKYFGLDIDSLNAPGIPFILGSQDAAIRHRLAADSLLSKSPSLNAPFVQGKDINLRLQTSLEPIRDFRIQVEARQLHSINYQEQFRKDSAGVQYESQSPVRSGNFASSFISLRTAFNADNRQNQSEVFSQFESNREIIRSRLASINPNGDAYNLNSQDVLIPAFLAAYSGRDAGSMSLSPFPKIPLPNWRVDYAGLSRLESLKKIFSTVSLTHSYSSNYAIGNYTSSLSYGTEIIGMDSKVGQYPLPTVIDSGRFVPVYIMDQVSITERFAPLIGINVRTVSRWTARLEYNQERNLLLQMSNAQITEMSNKDIVVSIGFTKANMRVPFKVQGENVVLKNDLNFRCDFTLRDSRTIQRKLEELSTVTAGNLGIQFKPTINYVMNQRLNLMLYFERLINEPMISTSFRRTNTNFGFQVRYSLSQ